VHADKEADQQLSIGRFAGLTGISANTLRRYDEAGLLSPAVTDPDSGYRLYAIEQLDAGILIRLLRDLDVPLDEVRTLMATGGTGDVKAVLAHHRGRIVERYAELERILARIDIALNAERGLLPYEVELVDLKPQWAVSHRTTTTRPQLDATLDRCLAALDKALTAGGARAAGREIVLYHNAMQWYAGLDVEVCLPVDRAAAEALGGRQLPGGGAMQTVYRGPWDDIWQAYSAMLARIARMDYEVSGPVREFYLADERDTDDPQCYVTEITWPAQPRSRPS
jgi:DNA-binding transcriptional MerR regulator